MLKNRLFLPILAVFMGGCSLFEDPKEISSTKLVGFASDTTAILFRYSWETTSSSCISHFCSSTDYLDVELQLVDVRFHKIYWRSKIENNYGRSFYVEQWSDSVIYFRSEGEGKVKYWLWAIGNTKPQESVLSWNTEEENLFAPNNYRWFRWENDSIVAGNFIIDTKTMTVNKWEPPACSDWWGKDVGGGGGGAY